MTFFPTAFCLAYKYIYVRLHFYFLLHFSCAAFPPLWPFFLLHSAFHCQTAFLPSASFLMCCVSTIMPFFLLHSALLHFRTNNLYSILHPSLLVYFCYTSFIPKCFISDVLHLRNYDLFPYFILPIVYFCHTAFFLVLHFCFRRNAAFSKLHSATLLCLRCRTVFILYHCFTMLPMYGYSNTRVIQLCSCFSPSHTELGFFLYIRVPLDHHDSMLNCWPVFMDSTRFTLNWNNV